MADNDTFIKTIDTPDSINQDLQNYRNSWDDNQNRDYGDQFDSIADDLGINQNVSEENKELKATDPGADPSVSEQPAPEIDRTESITAPIDKTIDTVRKREDIPRLPLGADIAVGLMTGGKAALSGAIKGINESLKIIDKAGTFLNELTGLPQTEEKFLIPDVEPAFPTVTGDIISNLTQFMTGFGIVGKVAKGLGVAKAATKAGTVAETILKGSAAETISFDEQQDRLSNIVEEFPALANPVTEYLAADKEDSFLEAKLKQAAEGVFVGAGLQAVTDGFMQGVKILRKLKKAPIQEVISPEQVAQAEQEAIKKSTTILGDIDNDRLVYKVSKSVQDVEGLSDKEIKRLTKKGLLPTREEKQIVVNLSRIETSDDIQTVMKSFVADNKLRNIQATRGVRTQAQTLEAAQDINGFNSLMERRVGQAFNAEEITAAKQWYYYITDKLMESSKAASLPNASKIDIFNFRKIMAIHDATQAEIAGIRAESGRALNAWKIPADANGVNTKALNEILELHGGSSDAVELAKKISILGNEITTEQLNAIAKKGALARTGAAFREVWTLGLLTSPPTHVRNIASSALTGLAEIPKRTIQAFIPESGVQLGEVPYLATGMVKGFKDAFSNGAKAFRTGQTGFSTGKVELPRVRASSLEELDPNAVMTPFAYAMDYWGRAMSYAGKGLAAGDEFARTILARGQANSLGAREGIDRGLKGKELSDFVNEFTNNLDPKSIDSVKTFAEYNIFINNLGETGQLGQKLLSKAPMLRFAVPFYRTPVNIFKYSFQHTPLAFASQNIRDNIAAGGLKRAEALSKIGLGTTIMQMSSDMTLGGHITGGGPTDMKQRRHLQSMGWKPYSLKIGDTYYSYDGLEPIATLVGMSADMAEILTNYESYDLSEQDQVDETTTAIITMVANQVVGKTFLRGVSDMIEAITEPDRYGQRFLNNYAGSLIPSGIGTLARSLDPESKMITNKLDALKARIPGISKDVPRRRNIWGESISLSVPTTEGMMGEVGSFMNIAINPIYMSKERDSPADQFMLESGFPISMPAKRMTLDGVQVDLKEFDEHAEMYSRLVELRGQEITLFQYDDMNMKSYIDSLVSDETDSGFFDVYETFDEQKAFLDKVVRDYTDAAKTQLIEEFPVLQYEIESGKEQEKRIAADPIVQKIMNGG